VYKPLFIMSQVFLLAVGSAVSEPDRGGLASPAAVQAQEAKPPEIVWKSLPGPGRKFAIDDRYVLRYEFNEKPKLGMIILKVQVFDKSGAQVTPFAATGRSDMPSMHGAHDSGDVEFKLNRKNDYLLPVQIAMPGDWEIRIIFRLNGKPVFYGSIRFDV